MAKSLTLHPSIIPRLDPEYAAFHNEHIVHLPQVHELPWDPSIRNTQVVPGSSEPLPVAKVEDFELSRCQVRVFTPEESRPEPGWPVLIFFHGGTDIPQSRELFSCFPQVAGHSVISIPRMHSARRCAMVRHIAIIQSHGVNRLVRCQMCRSISRL